MNTIIYFMQESFTKNIKIGITKNIKKRKEQIETNNSSNIIVLGHMLGSRKLELKLHEKFKKFNIKLEWFYPTKEILDFINNNCEIINNKKIINKKDKIINYVKNYFKKHKNNLKNYVLKGKYENYFKIPLSNFKTLDNSINYKKTKKILYNEYIKYEKLRFNKKVQRCLIISPQLYPNF